MSAPAKKIAIVTPVFPPYRGGIGKLAQLDAEQLAGLGFDVTVYVPRGAGGADFSTGAPTLPYRIEQLQPWFRLGLGAWVPEAGKLLRTHDLVLLHYPFFGGAEPLWHERQTGRSKRKHGKLVMMYHMDVVGRGAIGAFMKMHSRHLMPKIVAAADKVLVTSLDYAHAGNLAGAVLAAPALFAEMPPAADLTRFAPAPKSAELLEKYGIKPDEKVIVQVGGLDKPHYFKGVPFLLRALAMPSLQRARAVIVGDGDLRPEFEKLAAELGVAARVTFAGSVPEASLPDHYRLGDVFAFPSIDKSEAFGIVALEASACGLPVVASDLAGVRTVVRSGKNGLTVPPSDAAALSAALAALLSDDTRRTQMGATGRAMAEQEYSQAARAERWKAVLSELGV